MKRNQLNMRLTPELSRRIDAMAREQRRTRSNMAEFLLHKVLQRSDEELIQLLQSTNEEVEA